MAAAATPPVQHGRRWRCLIQVHEGTYSTLLGRQVPEYQDLKKEERLPDTVVASSPLPQGSKFGMFWDRVARPCLVVDASSTQSSGSVSPETFKECLTLLDQLCSMILTTFGETTSCAISAAPTSSSAPAPASANPKPSTPDRLVAYRMSIGWNRGHTFHIKASVPTDPYLAARASPSTNPPWWEQPSTSASSNNNMRQEGPGSATGQQQQRPLFMSPAVRKRMQSYVKRRGIDMQWLLPLVPLGLANAREAMVATGAAAAAVAEGAGAAATARGEDYSWSKLSEEYQLPSLGRVGSLEAALGEEDLGGAAGKEEKELQCTLMGCNGLPLVCLLRGREEAGSDWPDAPALDELWSAEELHHAMCSIEALATQGRWQLGITPDKRAEFDFLLLPCFD